MARKKKEVSDVTVEKGKELFDFINAIYTDQTIDFFDTLTDADKKKYKNSRYMIHRFISMNPNYAPVVNYAQKYTMMPERAHYLFLANMIPKGRQFNKYIKGEKESKYESWLVELVAKHYHISTTESLQYVELYYAHNKQALKELCELYGIDSKQLKKAKL